MRIEPYTAYWQRHVNRLATQVFGQGYFSRPSEIAAQPGTFMLVSHEDRESLLGFSQGRLLPQDGLQEYLEHRVSDVPRDIAEADRAGTLGTIEAIAVAPEFRSSGVGTKLVRILHDVLIGRGADKLVVSFKRGPNATNVDGMMDRLGFDVWTRLPTYWRERCESGDFLCADRHNGCTCEALLYRKAVY